MRYRTELLRHGMARRIMIDSLPASLLSSNNSARKGHHLLLDWINYLMFVLENTQLQENHTWQWTFSPVIDGFRSYKPP
jgi:hypothetical protein